MSRNGGSDILVAAVAKGSPFLIGWVVLLNNQTHFIAHASNWIKKKHRMGYNT